MLFVFKKFNILIKSEVIFCLLYITCKKLGRIIKDNGIFQPYVQSTFILLLRTI